VHETARLLTGDPALVGDGDPTVEGHRRLVGDKRTPIRDPGPPGLVLPPRLEAVGELDLDALLAEMVEPAARFGIRVGRPGDDAGDAGREDRVDARRRRAVVRARLHRHVEGRTAGAPAGRRERDDLTVPAARLGRAFADDLAAADDDRPHRRLRIRAPVGLFGELERPFEAHSTAWTSSP
jgi:hypothetical protein